MIVTAERGRWTVPPQRALWMPPGRVHAIDMLTETEMRTVYVVRGLLSEVEDFTKRDAIHAIVVTPLIRELILGVFDSARTLPMRDQMTRLLLHALGETADLPTHLPMPGDPRLRAAAEDVVARGDWNARLDEVAEKALMSTRSFTRAFTADVGLSFRDWRRRARIIASLDLLAGASSIKAVSRAAGFSGPAAYVEAFREVTGSAPGRFREWVGDADTKAAAPR